VPLHRAEPLLLVPNISRKFLMIEKLTEKPLYLLLLSIADDEFIIGYRNSEWTGVAPLLEEDVAFSSMAQDEIGHARLFYEMLAELTSIPADKIAYARQPHEFRCCWLVEHRWTGEHGALDWAHSIARHFLYDTADHIRLEALSHASYEPLANATQKILREEKYHLMHGDAWLTRLATLSDVSKEKLDVALNKLWPDAMALFEELPVEAQLMEENILPTTMADMRSEWLSQVAPYFQNLDLPFPAKQDERTGLYVPTIEITYGARRGEHTNEFEALWKEMTEVYRLDPEAVW
jgi:ring-1,2-phenylacetyl-CoA epoxidase subunit PaaC